MSRVKKLKQNKYRNYLIKNYVKSNSIIPEPMTNYEFKQFITSYLLNEDWCQIDPTVLNLLSEEQVNVEIAFRIIDLYRSKVRDLGHHNTPVSKWRHDTEPTIPDTKTICLAENNYAKLLVRALRYALTRCNHLEPAITIDEITDYIKHRCTDTKYWGEFFHNEVTRHIGFENFIKTPEQEFTYSSDKRMAELNKQRIQEFLEFLKQYF